MRAVLAVLLLVVATLAAPADAWSKCSVCEWIVGKLVSKGSCHVVGDACNELPPPWDLVCKGIDKCCCGLLMKFIQHHLGDAHALCGKIHMCHRSEGTMLLHLNDLAQKWAAEQTGGPSMPAQLSCTLAGVTWDAEKDFNASYAATSFDDFAAKARRADFSTFEGAGTRWVSKDATGAHSEMYEQVGDKCVKRADDFTAPFISDRDFWVNATYEGSERRTLIGDVDKYTRFAGDAYFVGFMRRDTRLPAEIWSFYRDHFRTVDTISGATGAPFNASKLLKPCTPTA